MRVDYPLNVDDDAIPADGSSVDPSSSSLLPTSMSFHLQHIRLAEICRSIADRLPPFFGGSPAVDYDTILTLDTELQSFLDQLPAFLRLDYSPSHHPAAASTAWSCQRSLINAEVHARRIKLHHAFLWRDASRAICLASARAILDAGRLLASEGTPSCAGMTRAAVLSHTFVAAIALVHDAQHSAGGGDATAQQQQHEAAIAEVRGTLERAARRSLRGKKFLHAFEGVVERHRGAAAADGGVEAGGGGVADAPSPVGQGGSGGYGGGDQGERLEELGGGGSGSGGGELDVASWQALYADLELWDPGFA